MYKFADINVARTFLENIYPRFNFTTSTIIQRQLNKKYKNKPNKNLKNIFLGSSLQLVPRETNCSASYIFFTLASAFILPRCTNYCKSWVGKSPRDENAPEQIFVQHN